MRPLRVLKEQFSSLYLIQRLSVFEIKTEHSNNYLGMLWEVINPMIQIFVYWFVFGYGIRSSRGVFMTQYGHTVKVPFLWWMLAGISVWFFFNQAWLGGTKAIYTRIRMMSKMSFPMSVISTIVIMAKWYQHLVLAAIIFIMLQFTQYHVTWYIIQLPFYMFSLIVFLISVTLITSTLAAVFRDMTMIVQAFLRILMYLTPVLWSPTTKLIDIVFKINPLTYIVDGYRYSLLSGQWYFLVHWKWTVYFWALTIVLFCIGSMLHLKFRDRFIDYA